MSVLVTFCFSVCNDNLSVTFSGEIRIGEINQILPYGNTIDIVTLEGRHLIEILETAVANVIESVPSGSFPQVSGECIYPL